MRISIQLAREGGVLHLVCGPGRVRDALTVTRLVEAIPTFESDAAALSVRCRTDLQESLTAPLHSDFTLS